MQWPFAVLQMKITIRCHEMVLDKSHMLGAMAEMLHHLATACRPAWVRSQFPELLLAACWSQNVDRDLTYSKLCYTLQHSVKLRGLLRGRA